MYETARTNEQTYGSRESGDMETAQKMVDEAANDFAGWGLTRDMQVRYNDTAVIRLPFINERI